MVDANNYIVSQFHDKDILNYRFPFKLWLLINISNRALNWNREGSTILLDYVELNLYLSSSASIFKSKSVSQFLRQLTIHAFERVISDDRTSADNILEFRHANFIQNRFDLVHVIQQQKTESECVAEVKRSHPCQDPCLRKISPVSAIERARLHLRILVQAHNETFMLDRKLSECDPKNPSGQMSVIELPADAFENPADSVSHFEENPEYAGYYGQATTEQIKDFFGEFLPIYAQENEEVGKEPQTSNMSRPIEATITSPSTSSSFATATEFHEQSPPTEASTNIPNSKIQYSAPLDATINDNKSCNFKIVEEPSGSIVASSVVGIDATSDVYPKCEKVMDSSVHDVDIFMDEYLKFKNRTKECIEKDDVGTIPMTDIDMKTEIKEENTAENGETVEKMELDDENKGDVDICENAFKSFLQEFQESVNLLYD